MWDYLAEMFVAYIVCKPVGDTRDLPPLGEELDEVEMVDHCGLD
jgi:hypothetical protein